MIDIQELEKKHARVLLEAGACNAIETNLPVVPPKRVTFYEYTGYTVKYEVPTLLEATDILKKFAPYVLPFYITKDASCTMYRTVKQHDLYNAKRTADRHATIEVVVPDGAPFFICDSGPGFSNTDMCFFADICGTEVEVVVAIASCPIRTWVEYTEEYRDRVRRAMHRVKRYSEVPGGVNVVYYSNKDGAACRFYFADMNTFWASMSTYLPSIEAERNQ